MWKRSGTSVVDVRLQLRFAWPVCRVWKVFSRPDGWEGKDRSEHVVKHLAPFAEHRFDLSLRFGNLLQRFDLVLQQLAVLFILCLGHGKNLLLVGYPFRDVLGEDLGRPSTRLGI